VERGTCTACDTTYCGDGIVAGTETCDGSIGCSPTEVCTACTTCNPCPTPVATIPAGGGVFVGATSSASGAFLGGSCAPSAGSPENTYEWTPGTSGQAAIDLCGSSYDTVLYIREGACNGTELACNDDSCGLQSTIFPTVTAGQTYTIVVDGYGRGSFGSYDLTVTPPPPPSPSGAFIDPS
jgi:hypothetical protein